jgi:hypothetical protein
MKCLSIRFLLPDYTTHMNYYNFITLCMPKQ